MLTAGLTGGIASGKSLAAGYFREFGASVIDSDQAARQVVEPETTGWKLVHKNFGTDILNHDETINRKKLGQIIFSDPVKRELLNNLLHPLILENIASTTRQIASQTATRIIIIEMPLLIECHFQNDFDKIMLVCATAFAQKKWLMERNNLDELQAEARIRCQMTTDEKIKFSSYLIKNHSTRDILKANTAKIYSQLLEDEKKKHNQ